MLKEVDCYGKTDIGRVRKSNQDHFLIAELRRSIEIRQTSLKIEESNRLATAPAGRLFVVADGMGGHAGGERASSLAIDSLVRFLLHCTPWFLRLHDDPEDDFPDELRGLIENVEKKIRADANRSPERRKMGTTLTMGYVAWPRLYVVHVGDSRCYLYRDGQVHQLTGNHTVAQRQADEGVLSEEEKSRSPLNHALWNFLGATKEAAPEMHRLDLSGNDAILLCTDGVTKHLSDEEIAGAFATDGSAEYICQTLVDQSLARGGRDNVTAVVARFSLQ